VLARAFRSGVRIGRHWHSVQGFVHKVLDPESVQQLAVKALSWPPWVRQMLGLMEQPFSSAHVHTERKQPGAQLCDKRLRVRLREHGTPPDSCALCFEHPIGLAAGFDKDARAMQGVLDLGFSFTMVGSVTDKAQLGTEHAKRWRRLLQHWGILSPPAASAPDSTQARMFLLPEARCIINRLGFPSDGCDKVEPRLHQFYLQRADTHEHDFCSRGHQFARLGLNLGAKPAAAAAAATASSDAALVTNRQLRLAQRSSDFCIINVSSPNTEGLRLRQKQSLYELTRMLRNVQAQRRALSIESRDVAPLAPLFLKLSPDLDDAQLACLVDASLAAGVSGLVLSNTTKARPASLLTDAGDDADVVANVMKQRGGLSGPVLHERNVAMIRSAYKRSRGKLWIIACGGIGTAEQALECMAVGASLVVLYTAVAYDGPLRTVTTMKQDMIRLLDARGIDNVSDLIGRDA
jgi:dihydroorotate dehydrogenase